MYLFKVWREVGKYVKIKSTNYSDNIPPKKICSADPARGVCQ